MAITTITPGLPPRPAPTAKRRRNPAIANLMLLSGAVAAFGVVGGELLYLGLKAVPQISLAVSEPSATSYARPDLLDRNGRLIATDVEAPSLFADPAIVLDRDEAVEKLAGILTDLDQSELRHALADRTKRFVWIRRGLSPQVAQKIHDLGLPGFSFRKELKRAYPAGELAGHVIGTVNVDNKGTAGIEKFVDESVGLEPVHGTPLSDRAPVRLSIDLGVQHALEDELETAFRRYHSEGAAGLVLDVETGEILASASLPAIDPSRPLASLEPRFIDRISTGTYELGSVFKTVTVALALDQSIATADKIYDVTQPLAAGKYTISDFHPAGRPLSVAEIFTHSSNVGAALLALEAGGEKMSGFLKHLGLTEPMKTEAGAIAPPRVPAEFDRASLITSSYGHGLAVAPMQFAAAAAALVNGGNRIVPTFLRLRHGGEAQKDAVVSALTSREISRLMRLNVLDAEGTGKRADVPGYRVGGKTGTAELAEHGGYQKKAVISSFLSVFPADAPKYLSFVLLFEPEGTPDSGGQRAAGANAAPMTARLVRRIAPQLGVMPLLAEAASQPSSGPN